MLHSDGNAPEPGIGPRLTSFRPDFYAPEAWRRDGAGYWPLLAPPARFHPAFPAVAGSARAGRDPAQGKTRGIIGVMHWKKAPESLVALFDQVAPRDAPAERRKMFGYPAVFVNGNMFAGLHEERLVMRLPEEARTEFLALPGAVPFEPMPGRPMKEYVVAPAGLLGDPQGLRGWLDRSLRYAVSLPPKEKKPRK